MTSRSTDPSPSTTKHCSVAITALLALSALSACGGVNDVLDLELARNEARYVPVETAATMALGVVQAYTYSTFSSTVQQAAVGGAPITEDGCVGVNLVEGITEDGSGAVQYDFSDCPSRSGAVRVDQAVELPELPELPSDERDIDFPTDWVDTDGDGIPDELPEDLIDELPDDLDWDDLADASIDALLDGSVDTSVSWSSYKEGSLELAGHLGMTAELDAHDGALRGELDAVVDARFMYYGGSLRVNGDWKAGAQEGSQHFSFGGDFVSTTGLEWTVVASNVGVDASCLDATSGEITAIYKNPAGEVRVTAVFDDVCDGCADLYIDGVEEGRFCLPEGDAFGLGQGN
jgi:hypothetical protein